MATLQVKGIEDDLYRALAARAAIENRSISQQVVSLIRGSLSRPPRDPAEATRAALELAGTWRDDRSAKQVASDIRKARRTGRRFGKGRRVLD